MAARIEIKRLVLTSPARTYEVRFHAGVNLISGPISTGKSSILELIDYTLGATEPPRYEEIAKCSDVLLELSVGDETVTFQRSLKAATAKALLYETSIDEVLARSTPHTELQPRHSHSTPSISLAVLERLGLALLRHLSGSEIRIPFHRLWNSSDRVSPTDGVRDQTAP